MNNEPEWFQQVLDRTEQTESNLTKSHMENLTIKLSDNTELHLSFELYPGESGSYNEPPTIDMISIETVELSQYNGKEYHTVKLNGIDDTLFPIDYGMLEHMITEHIQDNWS